MKGLLEGKNVENCLEILLLPKSKGGAIGLRVAGLCGVISPLLVFTLISLAIIYSPWFSWTENALSDLGVEGIAAVMFNSGLIVGGVLFVIFAIGLGRRMESRVLGRVGTLVLISDAVFLSTIGIFPETAGALHFYVSVAFFTLLPISRFLIGAAMMQMSPRSSLGSFTVLAGVVSVVVWTLPHGGVAIPETLAGLAASMWTIVLGVWLLRN